MIQLAFTLDKAYIFLYKANVIKTRDLVSNHDKQHTRPLPTGKQMMEHSNYATVKMSIEGQAIDFTLAKRLSEDLAASIVAEPMLLAWYDGIKNEEHPQVPECQHKPGWISYAEGHGACLRVDINENEYGFIFADAMAPT